LYRNSTVVDIQALFSSPNIARMFGKPGPSEGEGQRIVNFLIDQIKTNFGMWNADDDVLIQVSAEVWKLLDAINGR
jgi:hypothetical protein